LGKDHREGGEKRQGDLGKRERGGELKIKTLPGEEKKRVVLGETMEEKGFKICEGLRR